MEVILAKTAGFCFGVSRAVDTVYREIENGLKPICTYGPIIHNEEVVRDLENKGVRVLNTAEELANLKEGTLIIRTHGVGKDIYELLSRTGVRVVDATCPFVARIHEAVREQCAMGRQVIIVGNPTHPEVIGIRGWGDDRVKVIDSFEEFEDLNLPEGEKLCFVVQTTYNFNKFKELVEKINEKDYDITVINTICNATHERQAEAKQIARSVDVMLVIGGRHSSNTQKLFEICSRECKSTYYIQTLDDLRPEWVRAVRNVGITAGASTPKQIIEEVHTNVRAKF